MVTGDSGLFDEPASRLPAPGEGKPIGVRLDGLAEAAKQATQLAGKLRLGLNQIAENAQTGNVAGVQGKVERLVEGVAELSSLITGISERSGGLRASAVSLTDYIGDVQSELAKRGVKVAKGPEPYWLTYPAWFKVEADSKGALEVILNGERVDSVRPTAVAAKIADAVNEKFNAKQFKELLVSVRDLIRRAGAPANALSLEDIYEVLTMGSGRRSTKNEGLSKAGFYYSVHRLAESSTSTPGPPLSFPPADYNAAIFFTREGEGRKYMTVQFGSPR